MRNNPEFDWRTIGALNTVSALSQVGQFGIAFVMLPVWLAGQGLDAKQLGLFAASLWLGQLPGLALAPWLSQRFGCKPVIVSGLFCTILALLGMAVAAWPFWLLGGVLAGFGLGLRWIGLEPWLYHIAPAHARGRLVGFHETLIALAPIVAPVMASYFGLHGLAVFWIGIVFTLASLVPLAFARSPGAEMALRPTQHAKPSPGKPGRDRIFKLGVAIALLGGMMEAAVSGLFALFAQGRGIPVSQAADLLAVFGLGGLLMQYGVGWLADHRGVGTAALVCALGTIFVAVGLTQPLNHVWLVVAVFLLGGLITAFLTLALIASTMTSTGSIAKNVSMMSMLYTVSAIAGPLMAGATMKATNADALMWFTAAAALAMVCALAWLVITKVPSAVRLP
ncbi:MAG: MFS transporter [Rhodoferax sp.]|uniref:MFS transporter n=1 Tax=Rhodoferax sp. TaxID=50421 RepID=UPI002606EDA6|nr:MFS transporter [Rhodoferax sp.]MDD2878896.1 MFS transporter [Rhodoferax sp.]